MFCRRSYTTQTELVEKLVAFPCCCCCVLQSASAAAPSVKTKVSLELWKEEKSLFREKRRSLDGGKNTTTANNTGTCVYSRVYIF